MKIDENPQGLTNREWQVAKMMATGMRAKEVGAALGISQFTAQAHVRHMYEKLGCRNMASVIYTVLTKKRTGRRRGLLQRKPLRNAPLD